MASYAADIPEARSVNIWAPAPAEGLCTVKDRLQSCQTQILQRLICFPVHGQTGVEINHFPAPVICLMGLHPWLCRLAPPRQAVGRVHLFTEIEISQLLSDSDQVQTVLVSAAASSLVTQKQQLPATVTKRSTLRRLFVELIVFTPVDCVLNQ